MAAKRRKVVAEDINLGFGPTTIPTDSGGTRAASMIGIHTLTPHEYSVRDFGAVGDGIHDDWAAIQAAVDEAIVNGGPNTIQGTKGGIVNLPPGTYYISQPISTCHATGCPGGGSIPVGTINACITLRGSDRGPSVLFTDKNIDMVQMYSWSCPSVVEHLYIAGSATTVGVRVRGNQTTLRRNWFLADHSIIIESTSVIDTTGTVLQDNQCDSVGIGGPNGCITVTRSSGSVEAPNNIQIVNQHCYGGSWCLQTDHIWDSRVDGMTGNGPITYFMSISGATRLAISNVTAVGGNVNNEPTEDGIEILSSDGVTINNFIASSFPGPALNVKDSTGVVVTNFAFNDNVQHAGTTFPYEVYSEDSELSLRNGRISNTTGHPTNAIHVAGSGPSGSYNVDGVTITGSQFASTVIAAVAGSGGLHRVNIVNNDIRSTWTADPVILIGAAFFMNAQGNMIHGGAPTTWLSSTGSTTNNCISNNAMDGGNVLLKGTAFASFTSGCFNGDTPLDQHYGSNLTLTSSLFLGAVTFADLGVQGDGTVYYCSDCTIANPCAGSGTGAYAKKTNGVWICN